MANAPQTLGLSRVSKEINRSPVGLPTLALSYKYLHVLAPTVEEVATHPDWKADR